MKSRHHVLCSILLLASLPALATCTKVLDLDGYVDAAEKMCGCPGPQADAHCTGNVSEHLDKADAKDREAWLKAFVRDDCDSICDGAVDCYNRSPVCVNKRPGCECCIYQDETPTCSGSQCQLCNTCFDAISGVGGDFTGMPDTSNLCADSKHRLDELAFCVCNNCGNKCGQLCNTGPAGLGCSTCISASCANPLQACTADKSQPPP